MKKFGMLIGTLALGLAACGGDTGTGSGTETTTESYSCCINKAYYSCPNKAASDTCFNKTDPSGCSRDSSKDSSGCN